MFDYWFWFCLILNVFVGFAIGSPIGVIILGGLVFTFIWVLLDSIFDR